MYRCCCRYSACDVSQLWLYCNEPLLRRTVLNYWWSEYPPEAERKLRVPQNCGLKIILIRKEFLLKANLKRTSKKATGNSKMRQIRVWDQLQMIHKIGDQSECDWDTPSIKAVYYESLHLFLFPHSIHRSDWSRRVQRTLFKILLNETF